VSAFYTNLFVVSLDRRIKISDNFESLGQAKSNSRCHNRTLVTRPNVIGRIVRLAHPSVSLSIYLPVCPVVPYGFVTKKQEM